MGQRKGHGKCQLIVYLRNKEIFLQIPLLRNCGPWLQERETFALNMSKCLSQMVAFCFGGMLETFLVDVWQD